MALNMNLPFVIAQIMIMRLKSAKGMNYLSFSHVLRIYGYFQAPVRKSAPRSHYKYRRTEKLINGKKRLTLLEALLELLLHSKEKTEASSYPRKNKMENKMGILTQGNTNMQDSK